MPKSKGMYVNLPRLLKRQTVDILMLGYVIGYSKNAPIPILQIRKGIMKFMEEMGLSEEDYPVESACTTYYRMLKEYNNFKTFVRHDKSNEKRDSGSI